MTVIAVKYCGGCNSRYDRVNFVRGLQGDLPECEFSKWDAPNPDLVLVVYGCPVRCASHEHITGRRGKFFATAAEDRESLIQAIREALQ